MKLLVFLLAIAVVYGQNEKTCIHSNHDQIVADKVVQKVYQDMHKGRGPDEPISETDIAFEFVAKFNTDFNFLEVTRHEFISRWEHVYRDVPGFAAYIFEHLDVTADGKLTVDDAAGVITAIDSNKDGVATGREFELWMLDLYHNCREVGWYHGDKN
ncbi:uncharacterized protein LOC121367463 [Gigantopelta aegis]|uniref:uncharacterized protein LOC121367463 n=1 Tax=Gigantopelta aegis TaxID=1735272 RepID=UPI001B8878B5|nr:uncharacterized protein LOC121367463 [Gigantopelta aegis]